MGKWFRRHHRDASETTAPVDGIKAADLRRLLDVYRRNHLVSLLAHTEEVLTDLERGR